MSILSFIDLSYSYNQKKTVFKGLNAELELGKIYAILGSSGCGKTTLLSLLGGLDSPTKGKIFFNGEDITEKGLAYHRRNHVSFIFQSYNLIDSFIYIKDRYLPKNSFTRMYGDLKICQKILVIFPRSFVNCEKR